MPEISDLRVSFSFKGDAVEPRLVTEKLGIEPERAYKKGEVRFSRGRPLSSRQPTGVWFVTSELPSNATLEQHLQALLTLLEPRASAIQEFKEKGYAIEFRCGLFLDWENEGTTLSSETLGRIAALGADLGLGIYYLPREGKSPQE